MKKHFKQLVWGLLSTCLIAIPLQAKTPIDETLVVQEFSKDPDGQIAYGNGLYVYLTAEANKVFLSEDGKSWREETALIKESTKTYGQGVQITSYHQPRMIEQLLWDGTQFVGITDTHVITSTDGINWLPKVLKDAAGNLFNYALWDMAYVDGNYIFTGSPVPEGTNGFYFSQAGFLHSTDLDVFTEATFSNIGQSIAGTRSIDTLIVGEDKVIGFGSDNTIMVTTDGRHWEGHEGTAYGQHGVWDGTQFVTAIQDSICTSPDGIHWTEVYTVTNSEAPYLDNVIFNGSAYIATGDTSVSNRSQDWIYYYSEDAIHWEERILPGGAMRVCDAYGTKDGFIVVGNKIYYLQTSGAEGTGGSNVEVVTTPIKPQGYGQLITQTGESVRDVYQDEYHYYTAITDHNNLYEWGNPHANDIIGTPRKILENVDKVSLSLYHQAAITLDNKLYMWGENGHNEINATGATYIPYPTHIMDDVKDVSVDVGTSYVVKTNGDLYVKGNFVPSRYSFSSASSDPIHYADYTHIASNIQSVYTNYITSGYINEADELYMWGWNESGEVGNGTSEDVLTPVKVLDNVKKVHIEDYGTMALTHTGDLYLWGDVGKMVGAATNTILKPHKLTSQVKDFLVHGEFILIQTQQNEWVEWSGQTPLAPSHVYKHAQKVIPSHYQRLTLTPEGEVFIRNTSNVYGQLGTSTLSYTHHATDQKIPGFKARVLPTQASIAHAPKQSLYHNGQEVIADGLFVHNGITYVSTDSLVHAGILRSSTSNFGEVILSHLTNGNQMTLEAPVLMTINSTNYVPLRKVVERLGYTLTFKDGQLHI